MHMYKAFRTFAVLAMALAALVAGAVVASADPPVDLALTLSDSPDPVQENAVVTYTVNIGNQGPQPANILRVDITFATDTSATGLFVAGTGHRWTCTGSGGSATCTHEGAIPAGKSTDTLLIDVQAPNTEDGAIDATATVTSAGLETDPSDNTDYETTDVVGTGEHSTIVGPGGGTVTTNTGAGATPTDHTYGTVIIPAGGPGGVVTIIEHPEQMAGCVTLACVGDAVDVIVPAGYDNPNNPIIFLLVLDASVTPEPGPYVVFFTKPHEGDDTPDVAPPCQIAGVAFPTPCEDGEERIDGGDLQQKILLLSGDPLFQGGKPSLPAIA